MTTEKRKSGERNKPRKISLFPWEVQSSQFLLKSDWQDPTGDSTRTVQNSTCSKRRKHKCKHSKRESGNCVRTIFIVLGSVVLLVLPMTSYWKTFRTSPSALTLASDTSVAVDGECCYKMKQLAAALSRAEQIIRKARKHNTMMLTAQKKYSEITDIHLDMISGATAYKGMETEEWGGRAALWGVVPLWRAAPPPQTVLTPRRVVPGDCWPMSGSRGELLIDFLTYVRVNRISLEHIRPDAVLSAPKLFSFYGILENGTWIEALNGEYKFEGPAKQYFTITHNLPTLKKVAFYVHSNQGNPKYTCIYRLHVYGRV